MGYVGFRVGLVAVRVCSVGVRLGLYWVRVGAQPNQTLHIAYQSAGAM